MHGDEVPLFFYSDLFLRHPEIRDLFPVSMASQRDHLLRALGQIVADVDNLDKIAAFLAGLGRDHRKYAVVTDHYSAIRTSLLATLAHFSGAEWTADLAADWKAAYGLIAQIMLDAAAEDEGLRPAFWDATVISHEKRSLDVSVFRLATVAPLPYLPGQSVSISSGERPRIWRFYSMANAPREDATLDFHVKTIDGGALSMVLARGLAVGSRLKLGPAVGSLTLDPQSGRDILLVAGSTGLAPLKAILEQISGLADPPRVHLFFGARTAEGLYDLPDLEKISAGLPWLTVTPAVSDDPDFDGERGPVAEIVARSGSWPERAAYVSGPTPMVAQTVSILTSLGVAEAQIHVEDFGWSDP